MVDVDFEDMVYSNPFMFYKYKISNMFNVKELDNIIQQFHQTRTELFNLIEELHKLKIHSINYKYLFVIRENIVDLYDMPIFNQKFFKKSKKYMYDKFNEVFNGILIDLDECILLLKNRRELIRIKQE